MKQELPPELRAIVDAEQSAQDALAANEGETSAGNDLSFLVEEMLVARANVDGLEEMLKGAKAKLDELRKRRIPEKMHELGLIRPDGRGNFTHTSGARVHLKIDTFASIRRTNDAGQATDEHELALWQWLRESGHGDLIKETVNPMTLKSFCKERLEDGEPLPPGVNVYQETVAVLTKPREG